MTNQSLSDAPGEPTAFADWLDASTEQQTAAGVVPVFAGHVADIPAAVGEVLVAGDVAVVEPYDAGRAPYIGVAGGDGQLYNAGPIPLGSGPARLRVYRPIRTDAGLPGGAP